MSHHPDMEPILTQIRAGFGRIKDAEIDERDLTGLAHRSTCLYLAEKFNEACAELEAHLERKERAA